MFQIARERYKEYDREKNSDGNREKRTETDTSKVHKPNIEQAPFCLSPESPYFIVLCINIYHSHNFKFQRERGERYQMKKKR
jgi:hypothetical protein